MSKQKIAYLVLLCLLTFLLTACGSKVNKIPEGTCKIDYISTNNKMERITFSGGYLRSSAEPIGDNIVAGALKGSKGIIYGKRNINGVEWAKVTTREGVTGWYCLEPEDDSRKNAKNKEELDVNTKRFVVTYPVISGVDPTVAQNINAEINNYMEIFKEIAGPVGNNLRCLVTYNKNNLLSILFECPYVNNRVFKAEDVNDVKQWNNIKKYCYVSTLESDAYPDVLYAKKVDMQYGMVFDLNTGKRLNYKDLMVAGINTDLKPLLAKLGEKVLVQKDNFFLTDTGNLDIFAEVDDQNEGRKIVEINKEQVIDLAGRK